MFVPPSPLLPDPIILINRSDGGGCGCFLGFCSASQAERIDMLNIASNEKGVRVASGGHYEPTKTPAAASASQQPPASVHPPDTVIGESNDTIDGGVTL